MLPATVQAFLNIFYKKPKSISITKQNKWVNKFNIMREEVIKFHDERLEKLKEFDIKFKTLVQEYFPEPRLSWEIKSKKEPMLKTDYLSSNPQLLHHITIKRRMRELFFTDFLSFCNDFFSTLLYQVQKKEIYGGCFNRSCIAELFYEKNPSLRFSKKNDININFLYDILDEDISFIFLLRRLEEIVSERTGNSKDIIREILYLNPNFKFDINNDQSIRKFYYETRLYLSDYGLYKKPRDPKKFAGCFHYDNEPTDGFNGFAVLTEIVKNYKEYLKIDIEKEFVASKLQEADPRFITYTKNQAVLKKCCIKENTNLIDVSCEEHQNIVGKMRHEYCLGIGRDFVCENSYFHDLILG
ncbi:hypothetical protein CDIK_2390 [Cucumispora dikerogammari]|nr:hypothetical protein CDIK_2390 [Cucumispora dikerogammari]